jgi:5-formyltetrahydrofolate cyclo-ligase
MIGRVETVADAKARVRAGVLAARRAASAEQRASAAEQLTRSVLDLPVVQAARCAAAYVSFGTEPSTAELLGVMRSRGLRVLVPVLREDLDLDWAIYGQPHRGTQGSPGSAEPVGPSLGVDAVTDADVVVVPALAVGRTGFRLGRGGGSYDRALARVTAPTVALLYAGELLADVPAEDHDRRVDVAVLPDGVHHLPEAVGG